MPGINGFLKRQKVEYNAFRIFSPNFLIALRKLEKKIIKYAQNLTKDEENPDFSTNF